MAESVLEMLASDYDIVLTHGNGPQAGADPAALKLPTSGEGLPLTPLANCVADTQGGIGYLIQQALNNRLSARGEQKRSPLSLRWRWIKTIRALATRPAYRRVLQRSAAR